MLMLISALIITEVLTIVLPVRLKLYLGGCKCAETTLILRTEPPNTISYDCN